LEEIVPGVVSHAGTFNSNPLAVTAGLVTLTKILTRSAFADITKLSQRLAAAYNDLVKDNRLAAIISSDGISGALSFSAKPILNWRDFQRSSVGKWFLYYLMMLNRGIIPASTGPDEQWTISVQHSNNDVATHVEAFKEVAPALKEFEAEIPIVEAI
jgi:glutamate-1-semialdehyde 2,1-aminomutase